MCKGTAATNDGPYAKPCPSHNKDALGTIQIAELSRYQDKRAHRQAITAHMPGHLGGFGWSLTEALGHDTQGDEDVSEGALNERLRRARDDNEEPFLQPMRRGLVAVGLLTLLWCIAWRHHGPRTGV